MTGVMFAEPVGISRVAILLRAGVVRSTVPRGIIGAYCVYRKRAPVYVGRSDHCIRARLLAHAASSLGTHFAWERTSDATGAFLLESLWYHRIRALGSGLNLVHPARRLAEGGPTCPICDERLRDAMMLALRSCHQRA
jgi:hypothetical protein